MLQPKTTFPEFGVWSCADYLKFKRSVNYSWRDAINSKHHSMLLSFPLHRHSYINFYLEDLQCWTKIRWDNLSLHCPKVKFDCKYDSNSKELQLACPYHTRILFCITTSGTLTTCELSEISVNYQVNYFIDFSVVFMWNTLQLHSTNNYNFFPPKIWIHSY